MTDIFEPVGYTTTLTSDAQTVIQNGLAADLTATATTVTVTAAAAALLPASGTYTLQIKGEQMTVAGGQGTTTLTSVTRGVNGTRAIAHSATGTGTGTGTLIAYLTTLKVSSYTGFPTSGDFTITVGSEQMTVTAGHSTVSWTVTRGVNSTKLALHPVGATVYAAESITGGQVSNQTPTSSVTVSVPCPPGAAGVFISCATQDIRVSFDGTAATATNGFRIPAGAGSTYFFPIANDLSIIGMNASASDVSILWVK